MIQIKIRKLLWTALTIVCGMSTLQAQVDSTSISNDTIKLEQEISSKEDNNRNVMLNASDNTSPRDINIGLPGNVGGITILENNLPVVYIFWPELPYKTWRQSVGLERTGLLKMEQLASTMGDLGFSVNSYTQTGTKERKLKAKLTTNHFGWLQGDVNLSGPLSTDGWSYSAGAFLNYDPSTYDLGFSKYVDETKIFRAGVTKFFNQDRGQLNMSYKHAASYAITNYAVFEFGPEGKANEIDNFKIGSDSYIVRDGKVRFKDALKNEYYWASLDGKENTNTSHNVDIFGNYRLNSGWDFKFSTRFHSAKASIMNNIPLSIFNVAANDGYTIAETGEAYAGNIGTQLSMNSVEIPVTNIMGRFSIDKKIKNHNVTLGVLEQYYKVDDYISNRSFFFQTVENQPQRLVGPNTDEYGFYNYNVSAEYHTGSENKFSIYANDDWRVSDKFNIHYGIFLRHQLVDGKFTLTPRTPNFTFEDAEFSDINKSWIHLAGSIDAAYNINRNFGVLANFIYTEENGRLESYSASFDPNLTKSRSPLFGAGIFWNTNFISLISQATYLTKNNYLRRFNLVNPINGTESKNESVYYDIQTIGWTTDFVLKPFKGFNLHYLITLQDPIYQKFNFSAFGSDYDYSDNNVVEISKILMEIDPSYTIDKWKFWASFRYFSKQYASITNALYFAARWETFGGINYMYNDHLSFGTTVVNFLNQRGAKGTINGSELIKDATPYYGKLLTGSYTMPFTVQLSANINF